MKKEEKDLYHQHVSLLNKFLVEDRPNISLFDKLTMIKRYPDYDELNNLLDLYIGLTSTINEDSSKEYLIKPSNLYEANNLARVETSTLIQKMISSFIGVYGDFGDKLIQLFSSLKGLDLENNVYEYNMLDVINNSQISDYSMDDLKSFFQKKAINQYREAKIIKLFKGIPLQRMQEFHDLLIANKNVSPNYLEMDSNRETLRNTLKALMDNGNINEVKELIRISHWNIKNDNEFILTSENWSHVKNILDTYSINIAIDCSDSFRKDMSKKNYAVKITDYQNNNISEEEKIKINTIQFRTVLASNKKSQAEDFLKANKVDFELLFNNNDFTLNFFERGDAYWLFKYIGTANKSVIEDTFYGYSLLEMALKRPFGNAEKILYKNNYLGYLPYIFTEDSSKQVIDNYSNYLSKTVKTSCASDSTGYHAALKGHFPAKTRYGNSTPYQSNGFKVVNIRGNIVISDTLKSYIDLAENIGFLTQGSSKSLTSHLLTLFKPNNNGQELSEIVINNIFCEASYWKSIGEGIKNPLDPIKIINEIQWSPIEYKVALNIHNEEFFKENISYPLFATKAISSIVAIFEDSPDYENIKETAREKIFNMTLDYFEQNITLEKKSSSYLEEVLKNFLLTQQYFDYKVDFTEKEVKIIEDIVSITSEKLKEEMQKELKILLILAEENSMKKDIVQADNDVQSKNVKKF